MHCRFPAGSPCLPISEWRRSPAPLSQLSRKPPEQCPGRNEMFTSVNCYKNLKDGAFVFCEASCGTESLSFHVSGTSEGKPAVSGRDVVIRPQPRCAGKGELREPTSKLPHGHQPVSESSRGHNQPGVFGIWTLGSQALGITSFLGFPSFFCHPLAEPETLHQQGDDLGSSYHSVPK